MQRIYIQDRKGYIVNRLNVFLEKKYLETQLVFIENDDIIIDDFYQYYFVINNIDDFYYFVTKYRFFNHFNLIIVDFSIAKELKRLKLDFYTFTNFCKHLDKINN